MRPAKPEATDSEKGRAEQERRLDVLIEELRRVGASDPPASDEQIRRHRHEGRP